MPSILETITGALTGNALQQVNKQLGTNDASAQGAIAAALPVLLSALAKNASSPEGAAKLGAALARDHDGSIFNDVAGAVTNHQAGAGASILKHVLGARQDAVTTGLGQATGLDAGKAGALLSMLAPMVLGAVGRAQRSGGLDAGGLAAALGQEDSRSGASGGALGGLLGMLDTNHDGSVVDDVLGIAGKLFGKR